MATTPNLAEILAHLGDGVTVFDNERQVAFANDKASEILGATDERFSNAHRTSHRFFDGWSF